MKDAMQFPHEKLSVHQKALDFFGGIQLQISSWSKQHAFVDHLIRAVESILQTFLDTANAAAAKLAVFLDMAVWRGIMDKTEVEPGKALLVRVGQMTARKDYSAR